MKKLGDMEERTACFDGEVPILTGEVTCTDTGESIGCLDNVVTEYILLVKTSLIAELKFGGIFDELSGLENELVK